MVGEAAAGEQQGAGAGRPQDGCRDLCRDNGAEDIDVMSGPELLDRRVEDLARRAALYTATPGAPGARKIRSSVAR